MPSTSSAPESPLSSSKKSSKQKQKPSSSSTSSSNRKSSRKKSSSSSKSSSTSSSNGGSTSKKRSSSKSSSRRTSSVPPGPPLAHLALELTRQEWSQLSMDASNPLTAATDDLEVLTERVTALLLVRIVGMVAVPGTLPDLSTTMICSTYIQKRKKAWPPPITVQVMTQLQVFVARIMSSYKDVPYHNRQHAYHVILSVNKLLDLICCCYTHKASEKERKIINNDSGVPQKFKPPPSYGLRNNAMAIFACLFAAMIHDVEHQGIPNRQLAAENDRLAVLYNDQNIAENWSIYIAFSEFLQDEFSDLRQVLFGHTSEASHQDNYLAFRKMVISMVLSTDIACPVRAQVSKSKWKEAFGEPRETVEAKLKNKQRLQKRREQLVKLSKTLQSESTHSLGSVTDASSVGIDDGAQYKNKSKSMLNTSALGFSSEDEGGGKDEDIFVSKIPTTDHSHRNSSSTQPIHNAPMAGTGFDSVDEGSETTSPSGTPEQSESNDDDDLIHHPTATPALASVPVMAENKNSNNNYDSDHDGGDEHEHEYSHVAKSAFMSRSPQAAHFAGLDGKLAAAVPPRNYNTGGGVTSSSGNKNSSSGKRNFKNDSDGDEGSDDRSNVYSLVQFFNQSKSQKPPESHVPTETQSLPGSRRYRQRLGILRTVDLGGETLETYSRHHDKSCTATIAYSVADIEVDEPDELKMSVVMETILTAADVAHNLQSWQHMLLWSERLYLELRRAHVQGRGMVVAATNWYENQISFLESYILPLAGRLEDTGVFGDEDHLPGITFASTVASMRDEWIAKGSEFSQQFIKEGEKRFPLPGKPNKKGSQKTKDDMTFGAYKEGLS